MSVPVAGVEPGSIGEKHGLGAGDILESINGHPIVDVLDYRFHMMNKRLELTLTDSGGIRRTKTVVKGEYDDLGLQFDTYLMDKQRSCKNKCVFCFIDQLPGGLRDSLYFKDDDSRMSFLFGNYITLTNLRERDVERIIEMRISPVNVSVHTTNPGLRVEMMKNPHAGEVLAYIPRLTEAGIKVNTQLVLCPGLNDGPELERSLRDLCALGPNLQSVSVVPVGITRFRDDLPELRLFTGEEAAAVLDMVDAFGDRMLADHGQRTCFAADEFYLCAGRELPPYDYYEDFYQLENGVGLLTLLMQEFADALALEDGEPVSRRVTVATGAGAAPFLEKLAKEAEEKFPGLKVQVVPVANRFFGETITVSGLVCGCDILEQLGGKDLGEELLFPAVMLRHERDLFLDGTSVEDLAKGLGVPVCPVENDGFALLDALLRTSRVEPGAATRGDC